MHSTTWWHGAPWALLLVVGVLSAGCNGDVDDPQQRPRQDPSGREEVPAGSVALPGPAGTAGTGGEPAPSPQGPEAGMPLTASLGGVVEMDDGAEPVPGIEEGGEPVAPHPETPGPALEPLTLGHMIDHSWGIRLPGCETAPALEARIGPPPYTLELEGAPDPELPPRFPRETVIVVSRKEIVVNDLRVADVLQVPGKDDKDSTWVVPRSEGSGRVPALTSQLQQDVGHRATILRASGFSPEQAEGCDVATILMDEELPYRILAEVILSAGHADLFRFRLGTRSRDGVISYMAVTAPRLAPDVVGAFRLFGDAWWTSGIPQATDFEFALVNYIAAEETELRRGECDNDLPVCLDPGISSLEALRNRELSDRLASSLDGVRRSSRTPGCFVPAPVDNGASEVSLPGAASGAAAGPPGDADAAAETGSGQRPEEPGTGAAPEEEPVPAGTLVVTGESRTSVPFVYVRPDGAWLVLRDLPRGEVRRSEFFLYEGIDLLAMRMRELAPEAGVLFLGGDLELPLARVLEVADMLRYRCHIQSMSGRCVERERWLGSLVFFTSPPGHFELMPEPVPTPGEDPAGVEPGEQGAGTCSLRALQRAVEPVSQGLRACRGSGDLDRPLLLSVRWSGEGHLELLATDPPQPDETVRCFRAALGESATPRDGDCTASLLLPSVRPATGDGPL